MTTTFVGDLCWELCAARAITWLRGPDATAVTETEETKAFVDRVEIGCSNGCLYPEVTGYALSVLEGLISAGVAEPKDVGLADHAARFLCHLLRRHRGGVPGPARVGSSWRRYTFDTGMVLKGLVAHAVRSGPMGNNTGPAEPLRAAVDFLADAIDADGHIEPFARGEAPCPPRWSTRRGPYLLKAALGLACGYHALGMLPAHRPVIERALARAIEMEDASGFLGGGGEWAGNMHAHLYACEAAYFLGELLALDEGRRIAKRGAETALRVFRALDVLPPVGRAHGAAAERSDSVAQLLRLCLLVEVGSSAEHQRLAERLGLYQHPESGAVVFGVDYDPLLREPQPRHTHLSTHATLFAFQAWSALSSDDVIAQWRREPWTFA